MKLKPIISPHGVCYESYSGQYWLRNSHSIWSKANETQIERRFVSTKALDEEKESDLLDPLNTAMDDIVNYYNVSYVGSLAGRDSGMYEIGGKHVLVRDSPKLLLPVAGHCPLLMALFQELFGGEQLPYVYGWLHVSLKMFHDREFYPGQAFIMAGPAGCGKTLVQQLFTKMFGRRSAKPFQYMSGGTAFNSEIIGSEHLVIADESAGKDGRSRSKVSEMIKQFAVEDVHRCHGKGATALDLVPLQRLSFSVNDSPSCLMVIPPIKDDNKDKIMLFKVASSPTARERGRNRSSFMEDLEKELPAFVHFLLGWKIDPAYQDKDNPRMGVGAYHHPDLIEALFEMEPAQRLLMIVDDVLFGKFAKLKEWEGNSRDLEKVLMSDTSTCQQEATKLFTWSNACGTYLGELRKEHPIRITSKTVRGTTIWKIRNPNAGTEELYLAPVPPEHRPRGPMGWTTEIKKGPLIPQP